MTKKYKTYRDIFIAESNLENDNTDKASNCTQWSTSDDIHFLPTPKTVQHLTPGTYDIKINQTNGLYFEKIPVVTTGLIQFPDTNSEKIVNEIQKFWEREEIFRSYNIGYQRGIMLYGPPGSGKSSTIQLVMEDVIARNGVVINFVDPTVFIAGVRKFRDIQPTTPLVVLMEDIDSIIEINSESEVLNVLDGVNRIDKVVFLATTNYPEILGDRIINRPSRFDKRFKLGHPNAESRRIYFSFVIGGEEKIKDLNINLDQWVEDTENFSIAHLKELFVAVVILGDSYESALETLTAMREESISSSDDSNKRQMGFGPVRK